MSEATSAELARAICLRGIVATFSGAIVFDINNVDYFDAPWEALSSDTQGKWLTLSGVLERVTQTPAWEGALTCIGAYADTTLSPDGRKHGGGK